MTSTDPGLDRVIHASPGQAYAATSDPLLTVQ